MAEILLAVEETPHGARRFVIVKRIRPAYVADPDSIDLFLAEGRVAIALSHPNLPQAYELGEADGVHYLAMELIRGPTLLDLLRGAHAGGVLIGIRSAVTIFRAVAAALEHAHDAADVDGRPLRLIHRDVTPQNILCAWDGAIKLIDFGIAHGALQIHETAAGFVRGKLAYLAPEQLARTVPVDHRADIFALGIVMHETLLGTSLFRGRNDRETLERVARAPIPDPAAVRPDLPRPLATVVMRALARDPNARYPNATALLAELEQAAEACGLYPSTMALRAELWRLCPPARPQPEAPDPDAAPTRRRATGTDGPPTGVASDPELRYFLDLAGVLPASRRPRRLATTCSDSDFAELLAGLERIERR
jgi:serine/threonine-protein kinase